MRGRLLFTGPAVKECEGNPVRSPSLTDTLATDGFPGERTVESDPAATLLAPLLAVCYR